MKKLKKDKRIRICISHQGAPIVSGACIQECGKKIVAISINLKTKYCEVDGWTTGQNDCVALYIGATKNSANIHKDVKKKESTLVELLDFTNWYIFSASCIRYTLKVCLIKRT